MNVGSEHCGVVRMVMLMNIYLLWLLYVGVICRCICRVGEIFLSLGSFSVESCGEGACVGK